MLSCSVWFSAPSFWMGGGLESRCVGRVYGANGAVRLHETCRSKNTSIKLPTCIKLAFHFISLGRCKVKQPSSCNTVFKTGPLKQDTRKNNSSRDEIYKKNSRIHLDRL